MISTERLVEKTFELFDGDIEGVTEWLLSIGCKDIEKTNDQVTLTGLTGIRSALTKGWDPVTIAVMLGMLTAGPFWVYLHPTLLKDVNKEWKCRNKEKRKEDNNDYNRKID